jgi:mono/diheme cytochrome c family protein
MRPHPKGTVGFGDSTRTTWTDAAGRLHDRRSDSAGFDSADARSAPGLWDGLDASGKPLAEGEPAYLKTIPVAALDRFKALGFERGESFATDADAMKAMITRGQERFNIYCSVCHGFKGEGGDPARETGGMVGRRWKTPVPNFHDPKYADQKVKTGLDGYIFTVIRNGVPETTVDASGKTIINTAKPLKMPSYADKVSEVDAWAIVSYIRTLQAAWTESTPSAPAAPKAGGAK